MKPRPSPVKTRLKQTMIAKITGVTQPTISNWLKLRSNPVGLQRKAMEEHYPELLQRIDEAWKTK